MGRSDDTDFSSRKALSTRRKSGESILKKIFTTYDFKPREATASCRRRGKQRKKIKFKAERVERARTGGHPEMIKWSEDVT